jgi:TP901 family phage tail tape measure protein
LKLADAAEIASTALNAFKADNMQVVDAANLLAGAANASATDVGELKFGLSAVSAVAAGVGMSFADTSAALAVFAQNGLKGSDAGTSLKTLLMNLVPSGKRARETMHELGIAMADGTNKFYDAEGKIKSLAEISDVLRTALIKLNPKERGEALKDMFGSDAIRAGNILFKEGAKGVEAMASAMSKITAAETAATKLDNLYGSVEALKGGLETLQIELGEEFLPLLTDFAKATTEIVSSIDEMDLANAKGALAFAGTAASVALVASGLGKLAIAARGLFATMGPVGWLITGGSLLAGVFAGAAVKNKELDEAMLAHIETQIKEHGALDASIKQYDELKSKTKLTTDEFARFVDINSELSKTADPDLIARLKDEQDKLQKKSGLSNEELSKMVGLNGDLVNTVPEATKKITEQGNAILENTNKLKAFSAAKLDALYKDLELQKISTETKYRDLLKEETTLVNTRHSQENKLKSLIGERNNAQSKSTAEERKLNDMLANSEKYSQAAINAQLEKNAAAKTGLATYQKQVETQAKSIQATDKDLEKTREKLRKISEVRNQMAQIVITQAGLNSKVGEELKTIDSAIGKLSKQKQTLENTTSAAERNSAEYREAVSAIDSQIYKLQSAKSQVEQITGKASAMNAALGKGITKTVTIQTRGDTTSSWMRGKVDPDYNRHTGGTFPRLHVGGLASQFANMPSHNEVDVRLLRNEMVLTEAQQANLFRLIDAGVTSGNGTPRVVAETDPKLIGAIKELASQPVNIGIDGQAVAKATAKYTQKELEQLASRQSRLGGNA